GYTNAGKSTLLNALADDADVFAENRLFATLDATTRLVTLDTNKEVLMSDTVGFIRKLPHNLIESFKSTLDEVRESDVLIHVVDVTHPRFEDHIRVARETLKELDSVDKPTLMVFNKVDALDDHGLLSALRAEYPDAAFVSAMRSIALDDLRERLLAVIERDFVERIAYVPMTDAKAISHIHKVAEVLSEEYMYALNGDDADRPQAVARLRFRAAEKYIDDLAPMLDRFSGLTPIQATS
ncbi:MAG: GTPase HflX, partial [Bacteroidetes bacterium]|nr:GTPase HflX [Bacteroidota bacterium]